MHYSAVGVSFQSILQVDGAPEDFIKDRFISKGPWDGKDRPLQAAGIRLVYPLGDRARITLSIDTGIVELGRQNQQRLMKRVVIANANFHRDCAQYPAEGEILGHLQHVEEDWTTYQELVENALIKEQ